MTAKADLSAWIVDDDAAVRWVLERALQADGIATQSFAAADSLLQALVNESPDVLVTDIRMPDMDGLELMQQLRADDRAIPVIVMTAHADLDSAVAAYQAGAFEYLPKPFDVDEAVALIRRAGRMRGQAGRKTSAPPVSISRMIGQAGAMQEVFRTIGRLSRSSMTVLITGESGTGKELVARALHEHSPRAGQSFIALNTTAIAPELLESELFGHERGAFTGADTKRLGRFELADGGTLFLDEIGDMSADLQTRLLRVLAEGEFYRIGGQVPIQVDVRVVAATNKNLSEEVRLGKFREDLFHRLNVIHIQTPPLRERREDIPALLRHFLAEVALELHVEVKELTDDATRLLQSFDWPGNVRQLINACRRLTVSAPGNEIQATDVPVEFGGPPTNRSGQMEWVTALTNWAERQIEEQSTKPLLRSALPEFEKALICTALARANGRRQDAAKLLGLGRNTLTRKIRELDIDV